MRNKKMHLDHIFLPFSQVQLHFFIPDFSTHAPKQSVCNSSSGWSIVALHWLCFFQEILTCSTVLTWSSWFSVDAVVLSPRSGTKSAPVPESPPSLSMVFLLLFPLFSSTCLTSLLFLKCIFPEVLSDWLLGIAVCTGARWKCLCPVWGSPCPLLAKANPGNRPATNTLTQCNPIRLFKPCTTHLTVF